MSTAEQKEAAQQRRANMRALAKTISGMTPDERSQFAEKIPVVTIEGRPLSPFNQCMVAMQNHNATVVGGFRQWIKSGRAVMKGQHGYAIWVPIKGKAVEGSEEADETRFILGTVFDVTQTQEIETAQQAAPKEEFRFGGAINNPEYSEQFTPM